MTSIVINDLPLDKQLDQKALSAVGGGKGKIVFEFSVKVEVERKRKARRRLQPKLGYAMTF